MASLEVRPNKTRTSYRVVWWENGGRQQLTLHDAAEAARFKLLVEGSGEQWPTGWTKPAKAAPPALPKVLTFGQWAEKAITLRSQAGERTKHDYRRTVELHMKTLNDLPLAKIDVGDVAAWIAERQAQEPPVVGKTLENVHGLASSIMEDALNQHPPLVTHNPFKGQLKTTAKVRTEEMVFLTPQEFAVVLGHVRPEYRDLIQLLFSTGLRFGEATALRVCDVDLFGKRKTLTVTRAWKRTGSAEYKIGDPKTKRSRRTLTLSPKLVDMLIPHVASRRGDELLFPGKDGGRLPHIEVYKRGWAPAVARAMVCDTHHAPQRNGRGLPPLLPEACECETALDKKPRIHDLRHSHASMLIADGQPLVAISRRLGHASITVTIDRYGHLDPSLDEGINAAVDRAFV